MESIRATAGVKVVVLNHPRNNHSSFVPFADLVQPRQRRQSPGAPSSRRRDGTLNSSALRTDDFQVIHDWMALLNHGYRITGSGRATATR